MITEEEIIEILFKIESDTNKTIYDDYHIPLKATIAKSIINKIIYKNLYSRRLNNASRQDNFKINQ